MDRKIVSVNESYGNWLVLSKVRPRYYLCRCVCGREKEVYGTNLTGGASKGCRACMELNLKLKPFRKTHGGTSGGKSPTYISWRSMRARCLYKGSDSYKYYGGRGITICKRWTKFENFIADMGERPQGKSLDRIDSNGNYKKSNCRWSTQSEQMRNTRRAPHYQASL